MMFGIFLRFYRFSRCCCVCVCVYVFKIEICVCIFALFELLKASKEKGFKFAQ